MRYIQQMVKIKSTRAFRCQCVDGGGVGGVVIVCTLPYIFVVGDTHVQTNENLRNKLRTLNNMHSTVTGFFHIARQFDDIC